MEGRLTPIFLTDSTANLLLGVKVQQFAAF